MYCWDRRRQWCSYWALQFRMLSRVLPHSCLQMHRTGGPERSPAICRDDRVSTFRRGLWPVQLCLPARLLPTRIVWADFEWTPGAQWSQRLHTPGHLERQSAVGRLSSSMYRCTPTEASGLYDCHPVSPGDHYTAFGRPRNVVDCYYRHRDSSSNYHGHPVLAHHHIWPTHDVTDHHSRTECPSTFGYGDSERRRMHVSAQPRRKLSYRGPDVYQWR